MFGQLTLLTSFIYSGLDFTVVKMMDEMTVETVCLDLQMPYFIDGYLGLREGKREYLIKNHSSVGGL